MQSGALPGGDLEYAVLAALWDLGSGTARDIHTQVGARNHLAYTTTAKVLDRLHAKGLVARTLRGKAFVYRAKAKRDHVLRALARKTLARFLGPQPEPAIATLVDAVESVDPKLLDELARLVEARRRSHGS